MAVPGLLLAGLGSAHPYHLMGGNADTTTGSGVATSSGRLLAQSFQVARPFTLTRVALYVSDSGKSDVLWVGIAADLVGLPEGPILGQASNDSDFGYVWVNYDLGTPVNLTPGTSYWIVVNSSEGSNNNGYRWWNSGYNANATGRAANTQGTSWLLRVDDFAFQLYGWFETVVTLDHRAAAATALAGAETSFLVDVKVTGLDPAYNLTLDYSYPPTDLGFQRDSSAGSGLTLNRSESPGRLRFVAARANPGTYGFAITFLVGGPIPAGTVETANASLTYDDFLGRTWALANASASVRVLNLKIAVAASVAPSVADPGARVVYWLSYATDLLNSTTVNDFQGRLVLPVDVTFVNASGNASFDPANRTVSWDVGDLPPGTVGNVTAKVSVAVGLPPRLVLATSVSASYADSPTTRATLLTTFPIVVVQAPLLSVELVADRGVIRSNDSATYTMFLNNSGNGFAGQVWVNDTLDPRLTFARARGPAGELWIDDGTLRWNLTDIPPGATAVGLDVRALSLFDDGGSIENRVTLAYTDRLGHSRGAVVSNPVTLHVRAPRLEVAFAADTTNVSSGVRFLETIVLRNNGSEPARFVFLNETLDSHMRFILGRRDNTPLPPIFSSGGSYSWLIPVLLPGEQANITIVLESSNDGTTDVRVGLFVAGSFTDAFGREAVEFRSPSIELTVRGSASFFSLSNPAFVAILATAVMLAAAGCFERAFGRFRIEEVFLVRRDGILLVHRSRTQTTDRDVEVFAAMFTAVQDFVRDSFGYRPGRQLRELSFGTLNGFIAPGQVMYLAVLHTGRIGPVVARGLMRTVRDLEAEHAAPIETWDGKSGEIEPLEAWLESLTRARVGFWVGLLPYFPVLRRRPTAPPVRDSSGPPK